MNLSIMNWLCIFQELFANITCGMNICMRGPPATNVVHGLKMWSQLLKGTFHVNKYGRQNTNMASQSIALILLTPELSLVWLVCCSTHCCLYDRPDLYAALWQHFHTYSQHNIFLSRYHIHPIGHTTSFGSTTIPPLLWFISVNTS
jgi:hypothetical protein